MCSIPSDDFSRLLDDIGARSSLKILDLVLKHPPVYDPIPAIVRFLNEAEVSVRLKLSFPHDLPDDQMALIAEGLKASNKITQVEFCQTT